MKCLSAFMACLGMTLAAPALADAAKNVCPNGGFEMLNPIGVNFPMEWTPIISPGERGSVTIEKDTHDGRIAIRMAATHGTTAGINSARLDARKGTIEFWYKAVRSDTAGENLRMFVIGMARGSSEVKRIGVGVPKEHIGDGKWHKRTFKFDYSNNTAVGEIILAPRINEGGTGNHGEWIIDDITCTKDKINVLPTIASLYMPKPVMEIAKPTELVIQLVNRGDAPVQTSTLRLKLSDDVRIQNGPDPASLKIRCLAPNRPRRFLWQLVATKPGPIRISAEWQGDGFTVKRSRETVCVNKADLGRLCTGQHGFWRMMPKPITIQQGNRTPLVELKPKRSSELPDSYIGITAHLPRSRDLETIFEPEHLIDGDHETSWSGSAHATSLPGPTDWVQIDLGATREISEIRMVPYWKAEGFPVHFDVRLRHGGTWKTVYEGRGVHMPASAGQGKKSPFSIQLTTPHRADAVRVEAHGFRGASAFFCDSCATYYFRLSELEVVNQAGMNLALANGGATVDVSWTFRSWFNSKEVIRQTYKNLYDLGVKWNRVGQWGDWTCWAAVEQKKGRYHIDPEMDKCITESIANGVNILYTLCYGNPLYEQTPWLSDPGPVWRHGHPFTGDGGPTNPQSIQGFVDYAKFVARHFKGRIKYYEIWNEENSWAWYGSPPSPKAFGTLLRKTAKALKEIDPEIKVMVGGTAALAPTFISESLQEGGGKYLDAIGFHPYGMPYPEHGIGALDIVQGVQKGRAMKEFGYVTYPEMIEWLKKTFAPFNPHFELWANEWNAIPVREDCTIGFGTEITEAKTVARWYLMATLTRVRAVWWTLVNQNSIMDWAVLRMKDLSRKPSYRTIQAITTLLSGAEPDASIQTIISGDAPKLYCETLRGRDGEVLVAIWSAVAPTDDYVGVRVSLKFHVVGPVSVEAIDTLHALVQKIDTKNYGEWIAVDGLLVMDYPIILRIRPLHDRQQSLGELPHDLLILNQ